METKKHSIVSVDKESPAEKAGIKAGWLLLSVDGAPIKDVFDYRVAVSEEDVALTVEKSDGSVEEYILEKEEYEDPGLNFDSGLMDQEMGCRNKCVFCFVDQLPKNLRRSLYFKDDDPRLSFLNGNFVTLTNVDDDELDRLISYRLSPINISVHTTDPELRVQMLNNPKAAKIMDQMKRISAAGIKLNTQIVLCPGINDGIALEKTLDDLESISDNMLSIAVVPVGLTRFRGEKDLAYIRPFGCSTALNALEIIINRQQKCMQTLGRRLVFSADELYIKAGKPIPPASEYEDFYQIENGVGLIALFMKEMQKGILERKEKKRTSVREERIVLVTGHDAAPYLSLFTDDLSRIYNRKFIVLPVENTFFGETVTVAGLLAGEDIIRSIRDEYMGSTVLVPDISLRDLGDRFLDDMTRDELNASCKCRVHYVPSEGEEFLSWLDSYTGSEE